MFPTYEWREADSANFFVNRCDPEDKDVKVTFKKPGQPDFLTLCYDGEYRSGVSNPKRPQPTWKNTHDRAVELIGNSAHPHHNYGITEIVHCKSKDSRGVQEASAFCIEKWMDPIFKTSKAKVVVLLGSKVRDYYAIPILGKMSDFGQSAGYASLTQKERALRDIFLVKVGGVNRVFVFNWHPTSAMIRTFEKVYGQKCVEFLRDIISGKKEVNSAEELGREINLLF